jgi:uroporphyrinogen-III synthase
VTPLRLVVTASEGALESLESHLAGVPVEVRRVPLARFEPPARWDQVDATLQRIAAYDAVAVTSPRAAAALVARCALLRIDVTGFPPVWAAGARSAEPLAAAGAAVRVAAADAVGERGAAAALAAAMLAAAAGPRVLFACGVPHRSTLADALRAGGVEVDEAVCYRTALASTAAAARAAAAADLLLVASPAVAQLLADALPRDAVRPPLVAVGPTTAEAAAAAGWPAAGVAEAPLGEAAAEAVAALVRRLGDASDSSRSPGAT